MLANRDLDNPMPRFAVVPSPRGCWIYSGSLSVPTAMNGAQSSAATRCTISAMTGTVVVYLGLGVALLGVVSLLRPLAFLAIRSRGLALLVVAAGIIVILIGASLPAPDERVADPSTHLDEFVPVYQFSEFHSTRVKASRDQTYRALKAVTAEEINFYHTLVWIRRFGRSGRESLLNPPPGQPLLDVATRTEFIVLAEEPDREIVIGTLVGAPKGWQVSGKGTPEKFKALREPGFVLAAMNFRLEDAEGEPGVTIVTTETRVFATDDGARRRFAAYWRVIYPGSALIRRMWLRAIVNRAEAQS